VASCQGNVVSRAVDASEPACVTREDCRAGQSCGFPILLGCAAKGVCVDIPTDAGLCTIETTGCGCEGGTVAISGCENGFGYAPSAVTGVTPCGDTGVCAPASPFSYVANWHPFTAPVSGACTTAELQKLVAACFASGRNAELCRGLLASGTSETCLACLVTPVADGDWGPIVTSDNPGATPFFNVSSCVASAGSPELACAMSIQAVFACQLAACVDSCSVGSSGDIAAEQSALAGCMQSAATNGDCKSYASVALSCANALLDAGKATDCLESSPTASEVLASLTLACGPLP
jgi:hypothetical protein